MRIEKNIQPHKFYLKKFDLVIIEKITIRFLVGYKEGNLFLIENRINFYAPALTITEFRRTSAPAETCSGEVFSASS